MSNALLLQEILTYVNSRFKKLKNPSPEVNKIRTQIFKDIHQMKEEPDLMFRMTRDEDSVDQTEELWTQFRKMIANAFKEIKET